MTYVTKTILIEALETQKTEILDAVHESQEELARIIAAGFEQTASKQDLENVRQELKQDIQRIDLNIERIDVRLDNLAPQFEVDDLKRRTLKLEKKTGIVET